MDWITITRKRQRRSKCKESGEVLQPFLVITLVLLCHWISPTDGFFFPRSLFRRLSQSPSSSPSPLSAREQVDQVRAEQQQQLSFRIVNRPYSNSNSPSGANEGGSNNNQEFHVPPSLCLACEKFPWTPVSGADIPSGEQLQQSQSASQQVQQQSNQEIPQLHQIPDQPTATVVINALGESNRRPFAISFNSNQYPNQNNVAAGNVPQYYPSSPQQQPQSQLYEAPRKPTILRPVPSLHPFLDQSFSPNNNVTLQSASQNINSQQHLTHPPQFFPPQQQFGIPVPHNSPPGGYATLPNQPPPPPHFQYTRPLPPQRPHRPTILQPVPFNKPPVRPGGGDGQRFYPQQTQAASGQHNTQQNSNIRHNISPITVGTIIAAQHNIQPAKLVYQEHSKFNPPVFGGNIPTNNNNNNQYGPPPQPPSSHSPQNIKLPIISRPFATLHIDQIQYGSDLDANQVPPNRPMPNFEPVHLNPPSLPNRQPVDSFRPQNPPRPQNQQRPPQPSFRPLNNPPPQQGPVPPQNYGQPSESIQGQVYFPPPADPSVHYGLSLEMTAPPQSSNNHQISVENNGFGVRPVEQLPVVNQDPRHPHQITIPWLLQLEQENQKGPSSQQVNAYGQPLLNQGNNIQASSQQAEKPNLLPIVIPNSVHVDSIQEYQLSSSSVQNAHQQVPPGSAPSRDEFTLPQSNIQFIGSTHPLEKEPTKTDSSSSGNTQETRGQEPVLQAERAPSVQQSGWEIIPAVQTDITHLFSKQKQSQSQNPPPVTSENNNKAQLEQQSGGKERPSLPVPLPVPIPVPNSHASHNPVFIVSEHAQGPKEAHHFQNEEESQSSGQEEQRGKGEPAGVPLPNAYDVTNVPVPVSMAENGNGPALISLPGQRYHTRVNFGVAFPEQRLPFSPPSRLPPISSQHKIYEPLPASIVTALNHAQRTSFLTHQHLSQASDSSDNDEKKGSTVYINSVPVRDTPPPNFPFIFHQQLRPNHNFQQTVVDDIRESNQETIQHNFSFSSSSNIESSDDNSVADADTQSENLYPNANDDDNSNNNNNNNANPAPVYCSSHTQYVLPGKEEEESLPAPSSLPPPQPTVETEPELPSTQSAIKSKKLVPYIIYSRNPAQQSSRYWFDVSNFAPPPNQVQQTITAQNTQQPSSNTPAESESAESPESIVFSPPVYGWSPKVVQKNFFPKSVTTEADDDSSAPPKFSSQKTSTVIPFEIISVGNSKEGSTQEENIQNLVDPEELISGEMELSKLSSSETHPNVPSSTTAASTRDVLSESVSASTEGLRLNSHIRTPVINPSPSDSYTSHVFRFPSTSGYGPGTLLEATNIPSSQNRDAPTQTWRAFYKIKSPKYVDESSNNALNAVADLTQSSSEILGPTTTAECNTETTANFEAGATDVPESVPTTIGLPASPTVTTFTPSRIKTVSPEKIRVRGGGSVSRFPSGRPSISPLSSLPTSISRTPNLSGGSFSALVPVRDYRVGGSQQDVQVEVSALPPAGSSSSSSSRESFQAGNILTVEDIYKSSETKQQFQQENNEDSLFPSSTLSSDSAPAILIVTSTEKSSSFSVSVLNETERDGSGHSRGKSSGEKNPRRISSIRISSKSGGPRVISSGADEVAQSSDQLLVGVASTTDSTSVGRVSTSSPSPPLSTSTKIVKTVRVRQRMRPGSGANSGGPNGPIKSRFNGPGRIRVVQRPVTQDYIKSFPEFASPEGDVLGKEEEEEVKNAIIELKRSEVTRV